MKPSLLIFLLGVVTSSASARDTLPSSTAPWRCYTGISCTGTGANEVRSNSFVLLDYEMELSTIEVRIPKTKDDNGKLLSTVEWAGLPVDVQVTGEHVATCRGKGIWRFLYRSTKPDQLPGHVDAVVFASTTTSGFLRPFFVIFPDETETFYSVFESSNEVPFSLSAHTSMSGTGAFHSAYRFAFPKGTPHFLGRTDTGRRMKAKTYR